LAENADDADELEPVGTDELLLERLRACDYKAQGNVEVVGVEAVEERCVSYEEVVAGRYDASYYLAIDIAEYLRKVDLADLGEW